MYKLHFDTKFNHCQLFFYSCKLEKIWNKIYRETRRKLNVFPTLKIKLSALSNARWPSRGNRLDYVNSTRNYLASLRLLITDTVSFQSMHPSVTETPYFMLSLSESIFCLPENKLLSSMTPKIDLFPESI